MKSGSLQRILRKMVCMVLVLSMLLADVPVFASWNEDEDPTGNTYDEAIVSALQEACGEEYDAQTVLDRLYSVGVIDENGYPQMSAEFVVDGETLTTDELIEEAEAHEEDETVTVDGEETTWGKVQAIMQYLKTIDILQELCLTDGVMTEEHSENFYSLLQLLDSSDELEVEDSAKLLNTASMQLLETTKNASWPENLADYDTENASWFATTDSNGSGVSQDSQITVSLSTGTTVNAGTTITATVKLAKAQPVDVTMSYRVLAGSWASATTSGDGTLTWAAGESGDKTFNIYVGTADDSGTNGTESFVVQIYNMENAVCSGKNYWQQIISVNRSHSYVFTYNYTSDNISPYSDIDNKAWQDADGAGYGGGEQSVNWSISGVPAGNWSWRYKLNLTAFLSSSETNSGYTVSESEITVDSDNYTTGYAKTWNSDISAVNVDVTQSQSSGSLWFGRHSSSSNNGTITKSSDYTSYRENTAGELNSKTISVSVKVKRAEKDGLKTSKRKNATQCPAAKVTVTFDAKECTSKGTIESVTYPSGNFYSGQVVPITVKTSFPLKVDGNLTLSVNGQTVTAYETGSESKNFTFYYTVRELDTGTINVTGISSSVTGANGVTGFTLSNADKVGNEDMAGTRGDCKLITPAKTSSFTSTTIQIDDEMPSLQTVVVDMPISSFSEGGNFPYISWIASNTEVLSEPLTLTDASGSEVTVKGYVKSMYVSCDGGKTRYPLYVAIKNETVTIYKPDGSSYQTDEFPIKLVANICPALNTTLTKRRDTYEIFMDPEIASTYDYVATGCTEAQDNLGYTYYIKGSETQDAPVLIGGYDGKVFVKNAIFLKEDYTYTPAGGELTHWCDVATGAGEAFTKLLDASTQTTSITPEGETEALERKVIEVYAQDENVYNLTYEIQDRPDASLTKDDFTFSDQKYMVWHSSDETVATIDENGYITFTGTAGQVYFWLDVTNGQEKFAFQIYSDVINVKVGLTPYLQIPTVSSTKLMLENDEGLIAFSSNLTDRNKAEKGDDFETEFTLTLYDASQVTIDGKTATPKAGAKAVYTTTKASPADYTDVSGETSVQAVSSLAIAAGVLSKTENADYDYVAIVSAKAEATGETLSTFAKIVVQTAPAKVKIDKLDNYYVTDTAIPEISYNIYNLGSSSTAYYVVQQSGGSAVTKNLTCSGTSLSGEIDKTLFTAAAGQLKTIYTVTVYARRYPEDAWSADSLTLTVYDADALQILVTEVERGDLGGYTGGKEASAKNVNEDGTYTMDNTSYIEALLTDAGNQVVINGTTVTLEGLQNDLNLQAVVSINYGDYVWGMLSDQIKWNSSDSEAASLDYYQGGFYSDISYYTYPSYLPATDFLLVGHNNGKTTLTATHAINGMEDTVEVTVKTLKDKFYLFQFMPEMKVQVNYTNGDGEETILYSNDQGQLAVYEPSGIASSVSVLSMDRNYTANITQEELCSSEQNIAALQLYPVNNVKLHNISEAQICILDESGEPVVGQTVTVRAGVYRNEEYCPNALFRIYDDSYSTTRDGRKDIVMTTDSNGMLKFKMDAREFYVEDVSETDEYTSDIKYIFELDYGDDYYPEIIKLETYSNEEQNTSAPTTSTTRRARVGAKAPFIEGIEELQYSYDGNTWCANSYTLDLTDVTDPIGPNAFYKQVVLDTTVMLWGYEAETDEDGNAKLPASIGEGTSVELRNTSDSTVPEGQQTNVIKTEAVTDLSETFGTGETSVFVYPFSSIPLARNGYTMNAETFGDTGKVIKGTDDLGDKYEYNIYSYLPFLEEMGLELNLLVNGKSAISEKLAFKVVNLIDQQPIDSEDGALNRLIAKTDSNLSKNSDLNSVLDNIDMTDFLKLPFKFIAKISLKLTGGKMNTNIFPTSDPSKFYLLMTPSDLQLPWTASNAKITYNQDTRLDSATAVLDEMDISGPGGESFDMGFSGYMLLEATYRVDGWHIRTVSGSVKACTGELGKTFKWNMFVGPVPVNFCIGIGGGVKFDFSYMDFTTGEEKDSMDQLIDITLRLYLYLFGGVGVDTAIARLKVGLYGKIGVNIELARLRSARTGQDYHGQEVSIDGEVGITFIVGVLLVTYEKVLASTKFEIASWQFNDYNKIMKYWESGNLNDLYSSVQTFRLCSLEGEDVTLTTYPDGTVTVELDRSATQDRDYLGAADRQWLNQTSGLTAFSLASATPGSSDNFAAELQTNSYPYSNPVYTDDGKYMLYLSDADVSTETISAVAWADITDRSNVDDKGTLYKYETVFSAGTRYTLAGSDHVYTLTTASAVTVKSYDRTEDSAQFQLAGDSNVYTATGLRNENMNRVKTYIVRDDGTRELASDYNTDSLNASGTNGNYFAAWSRFKEAVTKEMGAAVNNDDLAMTMQTSEIIAAVYDGSKWVETQLTSDQIGDFSPAVASWGDKAIVVWQRSASSSSNPLNMNVKNELYYSIWDGEEWSTPQSVGAISGTLKSYDAAILEDGTAIISYIIETGDDADSTTDAEACYSVVGADGSLTTGFARLTNDERTDCNIKAIAVVRDKEQQFLLSWITQIDRDGDSETSSDIYNDLSVAIIDADGNKDPDFIDSIQADEDNSVTSTYELVTSAKKDFADVAVVWAENVPLSDTVTLSYDRLRFVKFYDIDGTQGVTLPVEIAKMATDVTIDHFDAYIQADGELEAVILGSDYSQILTTKTSSVDVSEILTGTVASGGASAGKDDSTADSRNILNVTTTEPIRNLYTAYGSVDGPAFTAEEPYFEFSDLKCGFNLPIQFAITNSGNEKLTEVTIAFSDGSSENYTIDLLPGKTRTLLLQYKVPTTGVKDLDYTITVKSAAGKTAACEDKSNSGTIVINRPDVGIRETLVTRESDGTRDIEVRLCNNASVPLAGSGKTVKLAFYKDSDMTEIIGKAVTIDQSKYEQIDMGIYRYKHTMDLEAMTTLVADAITGTDEMPAEGVDIYVKAWLEESDGTIVDEARQANNTDFVTVSSLLERNRQDALTPTDDLVSQKISVVDDDEVNIVLQNISLTERKEDTHNRLGNVRATALNKDGEVIGVANTFDLSNPSTSYYISVSKEKTFELNAKLTMEDGKSADDITSWNIQAYNERYTMYYTWANETSGDLVNVEPCSFNGDITTKSEGDYEYASGYVNYGFTCSVPADDPEQGERYFVGWYEVLGYNDGTTDYLVGENGFTADELALIDFVANPTYSRILADSTYDFDTQIEKDTVLYALFTCINVVDPDNPDLILQNMELEEDEKIKITGYTDDTLTDETYCLTLELVGDTFTDKLQPGVLLDTNIEGVQVKVLEKLGTNTRKNEIIRVQVVGASATGYTGQFIIDPGKDYFNLNIAVRSVGTDNVTANIKAFFQVHHVLDGVEKETSIGYETIETKLSPEDYRKDFTGYHANGFAAGSDNVLVSKDKTSEITLNYTRNTYTIKYDGGDPAVDAWTGETIGEITGTTAATSASYDVKAELRECGFTYDGYKFTGWNTKADGSGTTYAAGSSVINLASEGSVTLYAQWVESGSSSYTVEYYLQNISSGVSTYVLDADRTATFSDVKEGATATASVSDIAGYEFSAGNKLNITSAVVEDGLTVLKLYYDLAKVDVNFVATGATGGYTARYAPGSVVTVPGDDVVKCQGQKLKGWSASPDGSDPLVNPGAEITISESVTYYAVFEEETYTVSFDANAGDGDIVIFTQDETYEGSGNVRTTEGKFGETIILPEVTRTVDGVEQQFIGWYDSTDPNGAEPAGDTIPDSDISYYAAWGTEYTVKYLFQDIASVGQETAAWDDTLTETVTMWGKAGELTTVEPEKVTGFYAPTYKQEVIGDNTVVEVKYLRKSYNVSFKFNFGNMPGSSDSSLSKVLPYGAVIDAPDVEREGYYFAGWDAEVTTVPAQNVEYTAQWTKNIYTIKGNITNIASGASVLAELKLGDDVIDQTNPSVSGQTASYEFRNVPAGNYQVVITQTTADGSSIMTEGVNATQAASTDITVPEIKMAGINQNAVVEICDELYGTVAFGLGQVLSENILSGENVTLSLEITEISDNTDDVKEIRKLAELNDRYCLNTFDISLRKTAEILDTDDRLIAHTETLITDTNGSYIELAVPCAYSDVAVFRVHNSSAEMVGSELTRRYNGEVPPHEGWYYESASQTLYIYVDSFSTYVIAARRSVPHIVFPEEINHGTAIVENIGYTTATIKVEPEVGYVLKKLTAVGATTGTEYELVKVDENTYTLNRKEEVVNMEIEFAIRFTDVSEDAYYAGPVVWAYQQKIVRGTNTEETLFSPTAPLKRCQLVTMLWNAAGSPEPTSSECKFTDVSADSYYYKAVLWAAENGITAGTSETTFSPDKNVTRAQVVTFLYNRAGAQPVDAAECPFTDVDPQAWYYIPVMWAKENGVTAGTSDTTFSPDAVCTRAQMVTLLYNESLK